MMPDPAINQPRLTRTIENLVRAIGSAVESQDPFRHLVFQDAFPAEIYEEMLAAMPVRQDYRAMSGRARSSEMTRTKLDLFPECVQRLPASKRDVWQVVGAALRSAPVREALSRRLAAPLETRFGAHYDDVRMYPIPSLLRDVPGYWIGIHPDTRWKGITVQLYLPRDDSIAHVGTLFHRRVDESHYEVGARMRFVPNTGYAFAVGSDTYHSVDKLGPEVTTRDSIILTYFVDDTWLQIAQNRLKRLGNFLRASGLALRSLAGRGAD